MTTPSIHLGRRIDRHRPSCTHAGHAAQQSGGGGGGGRPRQALHNVWRSTRLCSPPILEADPSPAKPRGGTEVVGLVLVNGGGRPWYMNHCPKRGGGHPIPSHHHHHHHHPCCYRPLVREHQLKS
ncbi:unnamed protein product [Musa acuminata var. zebrina]